MHGEDPQAVVEELGDDQVAVRVYIDALREQVISGTEVARTVDAGRGDLVKVTAGDGIELAAHPPPAVVRTGVTSQQENRALVDEQQVSVVIDCAVEDPAFKRSPRRHTARIGRLKLRNPGDQVTVASLHVLA